MPSVSLFFKLLLFISSSLLCANVWASPINTSNDLENSPSLNDYFEDVFYVGKVCRESSSDMPLNESYDDTNCEDGYVLKIEQLDYGEVQQSIVMDDIPSTLWHRTTLNKLDNNTYLMHMSCGSYCGANTLIGRGDQKQDFDWWFTYDVDSRCAAEFDHDKMMWVARPFFSDKTIDLPKTFGQSDTAAGLKYTAEFTNDDHLAISEFMADQPKFILPNPCQTPK